MASAAKLKSKSVDPEERVQSTVEEESVKKGRTAVNVVTTSDDAPLEDDGSDDEEKINGNAVPEARQNDEEREKSAPPISPSRLTPHKRSADSARGSVPRSPSRSPAPKRKKNFNDYLREDDEKKKAASPSPEPFRFNPLSTFTSFVETQPPTNISTSAKNFSMLRVSMLVGLLAVGLAGGYTIWSANESELQTSKPPPNYTWKKAYAKFYNGTQRLQAEFPNQARETWIQLIASISSTLEKTEPSHPACITALLPPSLKPDFPLCFLTKVGGIINDAVAPILKGPGEQASNVMRISTATFSRANNITYVRSILEEYFKHQGKAVITLDLDKFKSEDDLMVFHGLCDNFYAVEKRATIFFPIYVSQEIFGKYEWIHERGADISSTALHDLWKGKLNHDTGPAMAARVADSVILLNAGDECN